MIHLNKIFTIIAQIKTPDNANQASTGSEKIIQFLLWLLEKAPIFIASIIVVFLTFFFAKVVRAGVIKSLTKNNTDDQVIVLASKVSYLAVVILGLTIALQILGIDISPVVGLIGLGFGFATQDIIKNFVCGALILIQEPFKIGDIIQVGTYLGKVEAIETRSTNIKTFEGQRVIIPNGDLFSSSVTNFSIHPERRVEIIVGVHYNTNLETASKILENIMIDNSEILSKPAPNVTFTDFADSSITISVKFWIEISSNLLKIKSDVINQIKTSFEEANIIIPYPIRTLDIPNSINQEILTKNLSSGTHYIANELNNVPINKEFIPSSFTVEKIN